MKNTAKDILYRILQMNNRILCFIFHLKIDFHLNYCFKKILQAFGTLSAILQIVPNKPI